MTLIDQRLPALTKDELEQLMAQPVWSVAETAAYLRVGQRVIRDLVNRGVIVAYNIGRWIRIPRERLLEDLERGRIRTEDGGAAIRRAV